MWTQDGLAAQLTALGLASGDVVMVHSSLRTLGPVEGGAAGVAAAIRAVIGPEGTLVVPAFTTANSRTSPRYLQSTAGLDEAQLRAFEDAMPAYDPATTPVDTGAFAEYVRTLPEAVRSAHPQASYAAVGPLAGAITDAHGTGHHGEESPMARLYDFGAKALLLGVGYASCTAFHLGEYRLASPPRRIYECVIADGDGRRWHAYESEALDAADFVALGQDFDAAKGELIRHGTVGSAPSRLFPVVAAVDFAASWLASHRSAGDLPASGGG